MSETVRAYDLDAAAYADAGPQLPDGPYDERGETWLELSAPRDEVSG